MMQKSINRRNFTAGLTIGGLALSANFGSTVQSAAKGNITAGSKELIVLSDGHLRLPRSFAVPNVPKDEYEAILAQSGQTGDVLERDCNVTVVRDGDRLVIFDVGAGPNFMQTAGKLLESLEEAEIDPADVTDVIFTHAHPDHIWGLVDDFDELLFPAAQHHINAVEWDFWRDENTLSKIPEERKSFVVGARNRFGYLEDTINLFNWGDEVLPGIEAVDTSGHTPGHTSFVIHNGPDSVMIIGDAITNVAVSFVKPEWPAGSDHDPEKGIVTRKSLLDRLATEETRIVGFHLPHPGIGRVERDGSAYRFTI